MVDRKTVNGVTGYEYAWGNCVYCGKRTGFSRYWKGLGPIGGWFVPDVDITVCGPVCSNKHYQRGGEQT